jgi:hypothetical protein
LHKRSNTDTCRRAAATESKKYVEEGEEDGEEENEHEDFSEDSEEDSDFDS